MIILEFNVKLNPGFTHSCLNKIKTKSLNAIA